jgi:hypothetical protein
MCNLYSITTNQAAIIALFGVVSRVAALAMKRGMAVNFAGYWVALIV